MNLKRFENNDFYFYTTLFFAGVIIIIFRNLYSITKPYIYTEDGVWLGYLLTDGFFHTLLFAKSSYFIFGNIILLEIANILNQIFYGDNLNNISYFITTVSYCFYSFVALAPVIFLKQILKRKITIIIWIFILLLPLGDSSAEIFARISNTGYAFYFLSVCICIYRKLNINHIKNYKVILMDIFIFVCCMTNPVSYIVVAVLFITEIYYNLKKYRFKNKIEVLKNLFKSFQMRSLLLLCFFLMISIAYIVLKPSSKLIQSDITINSVQVIEFFCRNLLFNFLFPIYHKLNDKLSIIFILGFIMYFFIAFNLFNKNDKTYLAFSLTFLMIFTIITLISRKNLTYILNNYNTTFPDRYFSVQNTLVVIVIGGGYQEL